jgi:hypothetical protein
MPRRDDEKELSELLRNAAGVVFVSAFVLIVVVAVLVEGIEDRTTLLLGLATSALTAAGAMFGVVIFMRGKRDE